MAVHSIFGSQVPASQDLANTTATTLGTLFTTNTKGAVTGLKWYCPSVAPASVSGALWLYTAEGTGVQLTNELSFGTLTPNAWNTVMLPAPVIIEPGVRYVVTVFTPNRFAYASNFFLAHAETSGNLTAPADDAVTPRRNGKFRTGPALDYPHNSFNATCYFADVLFDPDIGSIYGAHLEPLANANESHSYTLGTVFQADADGEALGARWKFPTILPTGTVTGVLYRWTTNTTGVELARANFVVPRANLWNTVSFSSAVPIVAGTKYVAAIYTPNRYVASAGFFNGHAEVSGHLTAPANDAVTPVHNGKFFSGPDTPTFPDGSFNGFSYLADVVYRFTGVTPPATNPRGGQFLTFF